MTNKSEEGTPVYRCELCGGVVFKVSAKITPKTLSLFITNGPQVVKVGDVPRAIVHDCPNGGHGIATIAGIVPQDVLEAMTGHPKSKLEIEDIEVDGDLSGEELN